MVARKKLLSTLLATAQQVVASSEFAQDAAVYADFAESTEDHETAAALRDMARTHDAECLILRSLMASAAEALARMPMDTD